MKVSITKVAALLLVVLVVLAGLNVYQYFQSTKPGQQQLEKVRIGTFSNLIIGASYYFGSDNFLGTYKKYGIVPEYYLFKSSSDILASLIAGKIDAGEVTPELIVTAWDQGVTVKIHSGVSIPHNLGISPKNIQAQGYDPSTFKSLKDFVGKPSLKINVIGPATGAVFYIRLAMVRYGLSPDALKDNYVFIPYPAGPDALFSGQIAAGVLTPPWNLGAAGAGIPIIFTLNEEAGAKWTPNAYLVFGEQFYNEHRDLALRFESAISEVQNRMMTDWDNIAALALKIPEVGQAYTSVDQAKNEFKGQLAGVPASGLDKVAEILLQQKAIKAKPTDYSIFYTPDYARLTNLANQFASNQ